MRRNTNSYSQGQKMQALLLKQQQIEGQLKKCEDNMDLFETYYLQNSWRTGNIYLGWPVCAYNQISEFMNRPKSKRTVKSYIEIEEHEKLFSISSLSSKAFSTISKVNYLATRQLNHSSRPKIFRVGRKKKNPLKIEVKKDAAHLKILKEEENQDPSEQEQNNYSELQECSESEQQPFQESLNNEQTPSDQSQIIRREPIQKSEAVKTQYCEQPIRTSERVTFELDNQRRTTMLENQ